MATPGTITLLGSGETTAAGRRAFEWSLERLNQPPRIAILETPAGFEPNSAEVAGRVADFLRERLRNFAPLVEIIPARRRGGEYSTDDPALLEPLYEADLIYLGAGSPTYAVRQLEGSVAWQSVIARHRHGAALALASAGSLASGAQTLPVYEIYKVGEELHWKRGLDLFGAFGLELVVIPHWDNRDGGEWLDTSRCYMGLDRFDQLRALLPASRRIVGIDEHTVLALDIAAREAEVLGRGGVTLLHDGEASRFEQGSRFPLETLGPLELPSEPPEVEEAIWTRAARSPDTSEPPPDEVRSLVERREQARADRAWDEADRLRDRIEALGWRVEDTADGPRVSRA